MHSERKCFAMLSCSGNANCSVSPAYDDNAKADTSELITSLRKSSLLNSRVIQKIKT